ncbi:MAG: ABC transporter permease [Spirochaetota bacterium]
MLRELGHFVFFLLLLSFFSYSITSLRTQNRAYLYSETSVQQEDLEQLQIRKGFWTGFVEYLQAMGQFSFGKTESGEDVVQHITRRLSPSLELAFFAIFFGSLTGIFCGLFCLYAQKKLVTSLLFTIAEAILSTPIFVVAILLLLLFFLKFPLLPPGGYEPYQISYLVLPGISLGSRVFARIFYYTYWEGEKEDATYYSFFLQSKGFSRARIIFSHTFRKIIPLLLVFILLDFSSLLSGAIIVEEIFLYPGIGKSLYYAIKSMDENLLRALLFYSGLIFYSFTRLAQVIQRKLSASP